MHPYVDGVIKKIEAATKNQEESLEEIAAILADKVEKGGILHILGTGHSHMIAEEVFYRAGGAAFVNPILDHGLMLNDGTAKSTRLERLPGYAAAILKDVDLQAKDMFLVVSNSGRNVVPIEATNYAKEKGLFTLAISSFKHSQSVESRHESGKRLFEITDLALDNYGELGDALLQLEDSKDSYGPTSSAVGIVLIQTLISMTIEKLAEKDIELPLFRSANLDNSGEHNEKITEKYAKRIPKLR